MARKERRDSRDHEDAFAKQGDFNEQLYAALRQSPWWMLSIAFHVVLFFVMLIALVDWFATSLYGRQQLRRIQGEQSALLDRDLVMHRQKQLNDRMKKLK